MTDKKDGKTGDESRMDPSSPYYLGSGDQPGNLITHVILRGENYLAWTRAMTISLKARRKYGFVDGTLKTPGDDKGKMDWEAVNSTIVSWILRSMESKLAATIPFHDNAAKLWKYLQKRFHVANGPRLQQLRSQIADCKQTKDMSIDDYYAKLMGLYDDLASLKPMRGCECDGCSSGLTEKLAQDKDEEILHQFLLGVDDETYGMVRSNLLTQSPITLEYEYQKLIQEEKSCAVVRAKEIKEEVHAFAVRADRGKHRMDKQDKMKLLCSHCKQQGHKRDDCFQLNGYPEWWEDRNRSSRGGGKPMFSGSNGRGPNARAMAVPHASDGDGRKETELSLEQLQHLMSFLNDKKHEVESRMTGPTLGDSDWNR